jgi:F-type H+-transporting ATPase subunit c
MLIGLALIESLCIYALVVSMIILFVHPAIGPAVAALAGH